MYSTPVFKGCIMEKRVIGIDYETTGFEAYNNDRIFSFCITDEDINTNVYRLDWIDEEKNKENKQTLNIYNSNDYIKVAHNAKFEQGFTAMHFDGKLPESEWRDTMIMSQMLSNLLPSHSLENLAKKYFAEIFPDELEAWNTYDKQVKLHMTKQKRLLNNYPHRFQPEIIDPMRLDGVEPFVTDRPNYGLIPVEIMNPYQIADGDRCMLLHRLLWPQLLKDEPMYLDFLNEMSLIKATQKMEQTGIMVHEKNAKTLHMDLTKKLYALEFKKKKVFGFEINLDSADQLQKHMFGYINRKKHIKLDDEWKRREPKFRMISQMNTSVGAPSASKEALELLQEKYPNNTAVDLLTQWRAFSKGRAMVKSYLELMNEDCIIHANIKTNEAKTGRQSVSKPSLQNVQKEFSIKSKYGIPARKCFRPRPGYVYFMGDYSGIEMRMIINAAGEQILIDKLQEDPDFDTHSFNAGAMLGDEWYTIDISGDKKARKALRDHIKDTGFAIPYGAGIPKLSASLKRPAAEVKEILKRYAEVCPNIVGFNKSQMDKVRSKGYITTAFGRKLYIWRDKAYTAANYQIQGDAAGTLKRAQVNIDTYLSKVWNNEIRMILPVHDEIIIEYPRKYLSEHIGVLHDLNWCMINIPEIEVPLMTEWKIATTNWQDAEGIEI